MHNFLLSSVYIHDLHHQPPSLFLLYYVLHQLFVHAILGARKQQRCLLPLQRVHARRALASLQRLQTAHPTRASAARAAVTPTKMVQSSGNGAWTLLSMTPG